MKNPILLRHLLSDNHRATEGFTLIEHLIGAALIAFTLLGAVSLLRSGTANRTRTEEVDRQQTLIDDDVSRIREVAANYTWCNGVASLEPPMPPCNEINPAQTYNPGNERYYFPDPDKGTDFVADFETACQTLAAGATPPRTVLMDEFLTWINNPQNVPPPAGGLIREAAVPDGPPLQQRVRISYSNQDNTVNRLVTIIPSVANWCP